MYICTLISSGMFSGLNLAFTCMTLDHLMMIANSGDENAKDAKKILPLRKRGNWIIATFAIGNVIVNIVSTLLMDQMLSIVRFFLDCMFLIFLFLSAS